ncbi:MAG TPA: serine hydrolase domain-containing protein [Acidimicrobiia bacterium]|nr:serine hydrolase domain-containing protein [Acidimicrobiia bacterium]
MTTDGWAAPGFDGVRHAFEKNFANGLEIGAAFAAYHRGELVVDLWGGITDPATEQPWVRDTLELVFSTTKGAAAICANRLAQEGRLDVDAPVVDYWPEFGQAGKARIPVSDLLSHQAGLAWVDEPLTLEEALSWDPMIHALERQAPHWEPGTAQGYHAVTYGYLVGELVRRITGRTIGTYFHDEIAEPLDLDFWIGLPEREEPRVARLVGELVTADADADADDPGSAALAALIGPDSMLGKGLTAGGAFADRGIWNTRAVHAAELPAAGGIGDARSIARMYAACVGTVDGVRLLTPTQLRDATTQRTHGPNRVLLDLDVQFGLGFMVPSGLIQLGGPRSFGHFGAGGSVGWADPDAELAFGYVMNRMDVGVTGDQRSHNLVDACYTALA